jgi:hypothetical protein
MIVKIKDSCQKSCGDLLIVVAQAEVAGHRIEKEVLK